MTILVTGVAGFIGSATARALIDDGHNVVGVDCLTDYYDSGIKTANLNSLAGERFEFVEGDLRSIDLDAQLTGVDRVIHMAGQPGVRSSWGNEFRLHTERNVLATQALLEACRRSGDIQRLVYASSSSVYGDALRHPTSESATPRPVSPYGVTKLAGEHLVSLYAHNFGVPTVSLRYFTVYGPGQRPDMAFTRFACSALADAPITVYGTGEQIRDFTYIGDVVKANIAATFGSVPAGSVFNVAGGSNVSMNEVLETVSLLSGRSLRIHRGPAVHGDVFRTGGSTEAIQEHLGWKPSVGLDEGLALQLEWARSTFAS